MSSLFRAPSRLFILIIILVSVLLVLTASNIDQQALALIRPDPAYKAKLWDYLPGDKERWDVNPPIEPERPVEQEMTRPQSDDVQRPAFDEALNSDDTEESTGVEDELKEEIEAETEVKEEPEFEEDFLNPAVEETPAEAIREPYPVFTIDPRRPVLVTATDETHFCALDLALFGVY